MKIPLEYLLVYYTTDLVFFASGGKAFIKKKLKKTKIGNRIDKCAMCVLL